MKNVFFRRVVARLNRVLRQIYFLRHAQFTPMQERDLIARQILRLLDRGMDQMRIRKLLVGEGLTSSKIFEDAWKIAMRYALRKKVMH